MRLVEVRSHEEMSFFAAKHILQTVKSKPNAALGLATGGTPVRTYELLVHEFVPESFYLQFRRICGNFTRKRRPAIAGIGENGHIGFN